jgi:hypothetical protein
VAEDGGFGINFGYFGMVFELPVLGRDKGNVECGMEVSRSPTCRLKALALVVVEIVGRTPLIRGNWVEIQWNWIISRKGFQSPIGAPSSALTGKSMNTSTSP